MSGRTHLADAFRWSAGRQADWAAMLVGGLGMGVPALLGAATGHLPAGLAAAVGSLLVGSPLAGANWWERLRGVAAVLAAVAVAAAAAGLIVDAGWRTDAAMVAMAAAAAVLGGYSRPLAVATGRFVVFLIIALGVLAATPDRLALLGLMAAGALWTAVLAVAAGGCMHTPVAPRGSTATAAQKLARWRRTLRYLAGWQFALRLAVCLGVASALRVAWPAHHFLWIALTVAILVQRTPEAMPLRTTQRAIGVLLGVVATALLGGLAPPAWGVAVAVAALAALRPWLRASNYIAYTACMTPLIILMLDAGRPVAGGILLDRLVATVIGAALAIAATRLLAALDPPLPRQADICKRAPP